MSSVENIRHGMVGDCVQVVVGRDARRKEWISGPVREWRLGGSGLVRQGNWCGPTNLDGCVKLGVSPRPVMALCMDKLRL